MAYITFELEDGTQVFIESVEVHKNSPGLIPPGKSTLEDGKASVSFEKQIDGVSKMSAVLMKKFREGSIEEPSDIDISFGLKASGEVGGFLVSRGGPEATFSVSLHWRDREKDKDKENSNDKVKEKEKVKKSE